MARLQDLENRREREREREKERKREREREKHRKMGGGWGEMAVTSRKGHSSFLAPLLTQSSL
jgi:hypothetical protein